LSRQDKPVSSNLDELKGMLLPGATGGPSGGLTGGVPIPPSPKKANPLDRLTAVTDALLANPPASEWLTWRRGSDGVGFSPLRQITKQNVAELRTAWSWSLAQRPE
jgi:hypothetical protein